jgi:hypothetical protein
MRRVHTEPWIKRYRPDQRNQMELGIYGGIMLPAADHELYDPSLTWQSYKKVAPDIGLRFGYYPLSFLGLEVEGGVIPTKIGDAAAPTRCSAPSAATASSSCRTASPRSRSIGVGVLGTNGSTVGNDVDPAMHFGGGVKFYINRLLALRLDVRDNVTAQHHRRRPHPPRRGPARPVAPAQPQEARAQARTRTATATASSTASTSA